MKLTKKIFWGFILLSIWIIASLNIALARDLPQENVLELKYKNYFIKLEHHLEIGTSADKLIITHSGKEVFSTEGSLSINQGYGLEDINNSTEIKSSILVVYEYSGGTHCCFTTTILELDEIFQLKAKFEGGNSPVELKQLENKSGFEIELNDWVYEYRWTSFAKSYAPKVILTYQNGEITPAKQEMIKRKLSKKQLEASIATIKSIKYSDFKYAYKEDVDKLSLDERESNEAYFGALLPVVLDLIYSGQAEQAWDVVGKTWPIGNQSKQQFIEDLKQAIKESSYNKILVNINKPNIL